MWRRENIVRSGTDLIGAVLFNSINLQTIFSELAARQAHPVGGHVYSRPNMGSNGVRVTHQLSREDENGASRHNRRKTRSISLDSDER